MFRRRDTLDKLLRDRLGLSGPLARQLHRAQWRLPRALRRDARAIRDQEALLGHPRLSRLVDPRTRARAERRLAGHLRSVDPMAIRRGRALDALALWAFYGFVAAGGTLAVLLWRGLI